MKQFNLTIPTPCHENWEQMTPAEQGRFCGSCQKTVIDFANMSDQQLAAFFKRSTGSVCGRFAQDQLERDIAVPAKRIPWVRYFFQFTLPAFLLSLKAAGQKVERVERIAVLKPMGDTLINKVNQEIASEKLVCKSIDQATVVSPLEGRVGGVAVVVGGVTKSKKSFSLISSSKRNTTIQDKVLEVPDSTVINGRVVDDKGNPIPFATVVIKGTKQATACDADGQFRMGYKQALPITLQFSSVGFESKEFQVNSGNVNEVVLLTTQAQWMGEVVIVKSHRRKARKAIPLISEAKRDTAFSQFSVYPNPARSSGTITLDCKKMPKGVYSLQIIALNGLPVCTRQLDLEQKGGLLRTDLPSLAAGQYVIMLLQQNGKKTYTEKIQVL